jgi:hypothetical protein
VAGSCERGDERSGSGATELVLQITNKILDTLPYYVRAHCCCRQYVIIFFL